MAFPPSSPKPHPDCCGIHGEEKIVPSFDHRSFRRCSFTFWDANSNSIAEGSCWEVLDEGVWKRHSRYSGNSDIPVARAATQDFHPPPRHGLLTRIFHRVHDVSHRQTSPVVNAQGPSPSSGPERAFGTANANAGKSTYVTPSLVDTAIAQHSN